MRPWRRRRSSPPARCPTTRPNALSCDARRLPRPGKGGAEGYNNGPMQALVWLLRLFIVAILIWFALKNSQQVDVNGFPGQIWQAPLVFVLLVVFVGGVVIGLLAW